MNNSTNQNQNQISKTEQFVYETCGLYILRNQNIKIGKESNVTKVGKIFLDLLTCRHTAFNTFKDFVEAGYTPTLKTESSEEPNTKKELNILANMYESYHAFNNHSERKIFRS